MSNEIGPLVVTLKVESGMETLFLFVASTFAPGIAVTSIRESGSDWPSPALRRLPGLTFADNERGSGMD